MDKQEDTRLEISIILLNPLRYGRKGTLASVDVEYWVDINELINHLWKLKKIGADSADIADVNIYVIL